MASSGGCQRPGSAERELTAEIRPIFRPQFTFGVAQPSGGLGVNTTGMDSRPLTKFAGRSGNTESSATNRRSGSRRNTRSVINDSSNRAS